MMRQCSRFVSVRNFRHSSFGKTSRCCLAVMVLVIAYFARIQSSQAVLVQTNSTDSSSQLAYPASSTDLINQGQPSLGAVVNTGYTNFSSFSIGGLNDGQLGTASAATPEAAYDNTDGAWTSEFDLNTLSPHTLGYTITEIRTIDGWISNRVGQQYTVEYSLINDPTFATLGT